MLPRVLAAFLILVLVPFVTSAQPSTVNSLNWVAGGPITALERDGNIVFVGGRFNGLAPRSQITGGFVPFYAAFPNRRTCNPAAVSGQVRAIVPDGASGWIVGGRFRRVGAVDRENLVRLRPNCTVDTAWTGVVTGDVNALVVVNGVVYVGGSFPTAGQQGGGVAPRMNLAAFSASAGTLLPWNPGADGAVHALKGGSFFVSGSTIVQIFAGGEFTQLGGQPRSRLGMVDANGVTQSLVVDFDDTVLAIELDPPASLPDRVWVAGAFRNVNGTARDRVALVSTATGVVDAGFNVAVNNTVRAITRNSSTLYLGGDFTQLGGVARNYVGAVAIGGATLPFNPDLDGPVNALYAETAQVYMGGAFTRVGTTPRLFGARVTVSGGTATLGDWNVGFNAEVRTLSVVAGLIAAGGDFSAVGAQRRRNVAAINLDTGDLLDWAPEVNGPVFTLALRAHTLYLGGAFTQIDGVTRNRLAAFSAGTRTLGLWNPNADGAVSDIVTTTDAVFAGGEFANVGGSPRTRLASLDPVTGTAQSWTAPPFDDTILTLASDGTSLYVGGIFLNVGGLPAPSLVRVNLGTGQRDLTWNPMPNDGVRAICVAGNVVYAGGVFTLAGGAPRLNLAALDRTTGLATAWMPDPNGPVNALTCDTPTIYAGGAFTTVGTGGAVQTRPRLVGLFSNAVGPAAAYATSFRVRNLGLVIGLLGSSDGVFAGANDEPYTEDEEPVARAAFFSEVFAGRPGRPLAPGAAAFTVGQVGQVQLRWSPPIRGPRPASYLVDAGSVTGASDLASGFRVVAPQLDATAPNGNYYVRIRSENFVGASVPSSEVNFVVTPVCTTPPDPPQLLRSNIAGNDVTLRWEQNTGDRAATYRLEAGGTSGAADFIASIPGANDSFTATAPTGVFYVRLRAVSPCGTSLPSNEIIVTTGGAPPPPSAPLDFAAAVTTAGTVALSWSVPILGSTTSYRLEAGSGPGLNDLAIFPTPLRALTFQGVPPGTYYVRIYALGTGGTSPPSAELIIVVP